MNYEHGREIHFMLALLYLATVSFWICKYIYVQQAWSWLCSTISLYRFPSSGSSSRLFVHKLLSTRLLNLSCPLLLQGHHLALHKYKPISKKIFKTTSNCTPFHRYERFSEHFLLQPGPSPARQVGHYYACQFSGTEWATASWWSSAWTQPAQSSPLSRSSLWKPCCCLLGTGKTSDCLRPMSPLIAAWSFA